MRYDLAITELTPALCEATVAAARLGLRAAVVSPVNGNSPEPTISLRHGAEAFESLQTTHVEPLWDEANRRARAERDFWTEEMARCGVDRVNPDQPPVRARLAIELAPLQASIPVEFQTAETITFETLLQLPRLPEHVVVAFRGMPSIEFATFLAECGVDVSVPAAAIQKISEFDAECIDHLLNLPRPGRIHIINDSASGSTRRDDDALLLVDVSEEPSTLTTIDADRRIAIRDMPGEGEAALLREFSNDVASATRVARTTPEAAAAGGTESELRAAARPIETGVATTANGNRDAEGMLKLIFHRATRKLLGVQAVGGNARQLADIGNAVIHCGGTIDDLRGSLFSDAAIAGPFRLAAIDGLQKLQQRTMPSLNLSLFGGGATTSNRRRTTPATVARKRVVRRRPEATAREESPVGPRLHRAASSVED